ncbi:SRPBCC family protein [Ramlibacter albus]|uniref:SRPBCC domain-containing protein n=1 Tax=Ramlibacter albus TaxID=2079448 RepID=A0A923S1K4_9BURK|nr:SRPBCC domain-containing protein [Ramlibacter albus]MBC5763778.1 SRPBCC domain-containing protein [Ramlibacter albus]
MSSPVVVRVTHRYNAPAERVFDAWLNPRDAGRFLFATRTGNIMRCEIDSRVGGEFFVTDRRPTADGDESVMDMDHRGTYVEIDRPRRLVFDFSVPPYTDDTVTRVALDFTPNGPMACELVLTHEMGDSPMAHAYEKQSQQGWAKMLEKLERELFPRRIAL